MMELIKPELSLPDGVVAVMTTRDGGVSQAPYESLNLGLHVDDNPDHVSINRRRLVETLDLPAEPCWLNQVHGNAVGLSGDVDASYTQDADTVLAIQTADCLPILLWTLDGVEIAAVHAGWQGLAAGVIQATLDKFHGKQICAWIGAHIRQCHYEVDQRLMAQFGQAYLEGFVPAMAEDHWRLDLSHIAISQLEAGGVSQIEDAGICTNCDGSRFYSYRRDGDCGRMAALIWKQRVWKQRVSKE